jgi:hypothetical protein
MYLKVKQSKLSTKIHLYFKTTLLSTKKNLVGTTAVHRGNSQSCGQLSNKYTDLDLFSSAPEKEKSLHASQSEQQKKNVVY